MKIYVAGDCSQEGGNSFLLDENGLSLLVDCGISPRQFPDLGSETIKALSFLFLTGSKETHCGSLPWLIDNGLSAPVLMGRFAASQIDTSSINCIILENLASPGCWTFLHEGLYFRYFFSGKSLDSYWYQFNLNNKTILFSGDYSPHSLLYRNNPIERIEADLTFFDCTYGYDPKPYCSYVSDLYDIVRTLSLAGSRIIFPVPPYGRGVALMTLLFHEFPGLPLFADDIQLAQLQGFEARPLKEFTSCGCAFLSDPELCRTKIQEDCTYILTGPCKEGSLAETLLKTGRALYKRYPIHPNYAEALDLVGKNQFTRTFLTNAKKEDFTDILLPDSIQIAHYQETIEV